MKKLLCMFLWAVSVPALAQLRSPDADGEVIGAAAAKGDIAALTAALARGASIEARDGQGWPPLICAIHAGKREAVQFLLSKGANPADRTAAGCSTIDFALTDGYADLVTTLLAAHADPNGFYATCEDGTTWSPLFKALHQHDPAMAALLLAHGARVNDKNNHGDTALMEASRLPYADQIKLLLENGADVNARGPRGHTALIYAAFNGCEENVNLLLAKGADTQAAAVDSPGEKSYGAWEMAIDQGHPYVLEALADAGAKPAHPAKALNEELNEALGRSDYERVEAALAKGASATEPDSRDALPLMVAVLKGDPGIVQLLIKAGADVNASPGGDPRETPLANIQWGLTHAKTPQEKERFQRIGEILRKAGATR